MAGGLRGKTATRQENPNGSHQTHVAARAGKEPNDAIQRQGGLTPAFERIRE
jgi:hypothetical protein